MLAPHTSLLQKFCAKESMTMERKTIKHKRGFTHNMCTSHYSDPGGFTQAWCVIMSMVCDIVPGM